MANRRPYVDGDEQAFKDAKYKPQRDTSNLFPDKLPSVPQEVTKGKISDLPGINVGDEVIIAGNDFTINGVTYYGQSIDISTSNPVDSIISTTKLGTFDVEIQGIFQAKRMVAFKNVVATNPLETISYMRVKYSGRAVVLSEASVFFVGTPEKDGMKFYQRDRANKIIPPTIDKGTLAQDSGAYNKLAFLLYGNSEKENIAKARAMAEGLKEETKVEKITDTSKDSKELEAEKFMRDKLREWGVTVPDPDSLSGKALEDHYTREHQKRVAVPTKKRGIQPNPQVQLVAPSISHPVLPETGFRKYASKILLVTLVGAGVIMYQRSIASRQNSQMTSE